MAEVAVPGMLFTEILRLIAELRLPPDPPMWHGRPSTSMMPSCLEIDPFADALVTLVKLFE
jgi:hypothetical protein